MKTSTIKRQNWMSKRTLYAIIAVLSLLYVGLTFQLSQADEVSGMSPVKLFLVKLTIILPIIFIWIMAARGARRFKNYAVSIADSPDGRSMNWIANGLLLLVAYIIALNFASIIVAVFADSTIVRAIVFATNHLPIVIALAASISLYRGSRGLVRLIRTHYWTLRRLLYLIIPFSIFMLLFTIDFYTKAPNLLFENGVKRFTLPANALLVTYILPHVMIWVLGFMSALNIAWYAKHVPGAIYKSLFTDFNHGIVLVYTCIFLAQLLISSPIVSNVYGVGIVLIYAVLILAIVGFQLIFRGAVKLQKIEEIG